MSEGKERVELAQDRRELPHSPRLLTGCPGEHQPRPGVYTWFLAAKSCAAFSRTPPSGKAGDICLDMSLFLTVFPFT